MQTRPYVFVNMAMTADGKIDTVERQGARISGPADTARVDRLRAESDAIMVGGQTLLAEDPRLTVRDDALITERIKTGRSAQPMKVGIASRLGSVDLALLGAFLREGGGRVLLCTSERTSETALAEFRSAGAEVVVAGRQGVDLGASLAAIAGMGVERLMVEGGGTLVAALLEAGLVDEIQLAVAPLLFGGEDAPTPVGGAGWARRDALSLELLETTTSGDGDVISRYRVRQGPPS